MNDPNPYAPPQQPIEPAIPAGAKRCAPCPSCGSVYAKPITFTWWGGLVGPKLFSHVACYQCNTAYNGKTGKSNNTAIAIYVGVGLVVALIVGLVAALGAANS
jgi:hypothetical protein